MDSLINNSDALTLEAEANSGLVFQSEEIVDAQKLQAWSLVGRILTNRSIKAPIMKNTFADLWRPTKGLVIEEIGTNLFRFDFFHPLERERVIRGGPWTYDQNLLLVKKIEIGENPKEVALTHTHFWIQVYDLPHGFMSEKVAEGIGNFVGVFIKSDSNNFTGINRSYLRIRVSINVLQTLTRKMKISKQGGEVSWIHFKYERLPPFCFFCGCIGHPDKYCPTLLEDVEPNKVERA